jgi:hypothetical protein
MTPIIPPTQRTVRTTTSTREKRASTRLTRSIPETCPRRSLLDEACVTVERAESGDTPTQEQRETAYDCHA